MSDRPILFSSPMIRALLEGRKTMTRRIVGGGADVCSPEPDVLLDFIEQRRAFFAGDGRAIITGKPVRFAPGDRLWVREAWRTPDNWNRKPAEIVASCQEAGWKQAWCPIQFEADKLRVNWGDWREHEAGRLRDDDRAA